MKTINREDFEWNGCDNCKKKNVPTEKFEGLCGGTLWICDKCYKNLIRKDGRTN